MAHFKTVELPRGATSRKLGFGAAPIRRGMPANHPDVLRMVGSLKRQVQYPTYNMPDIETVTIHYEGPLTAQDIDKSFGARLDPLSSSLNSPPPGATEIESTFVDPGKVQQPTLVCAICWQFDVEPVEFTAPINLFTQSPEISVSKPVSPDFFTENELNNIVSGYNALGMTAGQQMIPGNLEWGWWQGLAAYYMSRAYNLVWQVAHNKTLLNDELRYTMYVPGNAQNGSASSSEVDISYFLRRTNDYYRKVSSALTGLSIDRQRIGPFTGATEVPALGVFGIYHPTRAFERVGATYGGAGVRSLIGRNPEFRKLTAPYLLKPGVALGLHAKVSNEPLRQLMAAYLDVNSGFAGPVPFPFSDDETILTGSGIAGTGTGSIQGSPITGAELTLDPTPVPFNQMVPTGRIPMKGGGWSLRVGLKGWELDDDTADALQDPAIASLIQQECGGCMIGTNT